MKRTFQLFFIGALAITLGACTVTGPKGIEYHQVPVDSDAFKIKHKAIVTWQTQSTDNCSEVHFLTKFTGKIRQDKSGEEMHIDNILDIHVSWTESKRSFMGMEKTTQYDCEYWGIAVEYVK